MSDMTREERLKWLKQIEKDIYVCSLESTFADDMKSCAIHSAIEELEQISILKDAYNKGYEDGQEVIAFHLELCKDEGSIIEIPEGVSNMELMQAVFHIDFTELRTEDDWMEWMNAPYKRE